ncbi:MAG: hypothetical protein MRY74_01385 [Neomegalonema sp.]|nr:hypothetical protein [Neomegalonema sp.]
MIEATNAIAPIAPALNKVGQPSSIDPTHGLGLSTDQRPAPSVPVVAGASPPAAGQIARAIAEIQESQRANKESMLRAMADDALTKSKEGDGAKILKQSQAGPTEMARGEGVEGETSRAKEREAAEDRAFAIGDRFSKRGEQLSEEQAAFEAQMRASEGYDQAMQAQQRQEEKYAASRIFL